jgi:hypothetical protein
MKRFFITPPLLVIAFLIAAVIGTAPTKVFAQADGGNRVEGSWYVTVNVTETNATFDATYAFAKGGAFTRIDGRNNAPSVGTWKYTDDGRIVVTFILFNFTATGARNGAIAAKISARVVDGTMTGTFTADGILGLTGFHRSGTFTGTPIVAEGP